MSTARHPDKPFVCLTMSMKCYLEDVRGTTTHTAVQFVLFRQVMLRQVAILCIAFAGLVGPQNLTVESENMISTQAAGAAVTLSSEVPLLDDSLSEVSWRIDQTEIALVKANSSTVEAVILPTVYKSRILVSAKMIEPTEIRHTLILRNLSVSDSGSLVQSQWNFESEEFVLNVKYCDKSSNSVAAGTIVQPEQCSFGCTATMDCDKEYYSESFMYNVSTTCLENAEWSKNIKCRRLEVTDRPRDAAIAVAVIAILWTLCTGIWIRMLCKRARLSKCKVAFEITLDVILLATSMALLLAMDWNVSGSLTPGGIAGLTFGIFAVASPLICIYPLSKGFFDDTTAASDAKPSIPIQEVMY